VSCPSLAPSPERGACKRRWPERVVAAGAGEGGRGGRRGRARREGEKAAQEIWAPALAPARDFWSRAEKGGEKKM